MAPDSEGGGPRVSTALLNHIGRALAVLGIVFVGLQIHEQYQPLRGAVAQTSLVILILGAAIYTAALGSLSLAWMVVLNNYQGAKFAFAACHFSYARSQIAKYLPGNVFHYAGRYALSRSMGASDRAVLSATIEELLGVAAVFALCGTLAASVSPERIEIFGLMPLTALGVLMTAALFGVRALLMSRLVGRYQLAPGSLRLLQGWGLYALFLLLSLSVMLMLTGQFRQMVTVSEQATLMSAFCLSWLVGFLVPGAPGGIGVREAAFIVLLEPLGMGPQALSMVLQFRLITIIGDVLFFGSTFYRQQAASA